MKAIDMQIGRTYLAHLDSQGRFGIDESSQDVAIRVSSISYSSKIKELCEENDIWVEGDRMINVKGHGNLTQWDIPADELVYEVIG
tara:strand:- start:487 stop:744 length:258 start_codon:yes stop_codon:yes gene_type:complete